ncbi:hypothetical protein VNI00_016789 [Paramarasmius palmivorus]|uniref:Uncharacterized protein n=1 Tax=Paramarasmius palmivorus TaxID=297713 RepID=A0AAW0BAX3_9AGAR
MKIHHGSVNIPDAELYEFLTLCPELSQLECDVLNPRRKDMVPGTFVCQLLDVLCPANSHQLPIPFTPAPNSKLAHVVISERWFLLDPGAVDRLLGRLEAKVGDLKDYRARVPVPRWKWDLWFGAPPECAPEVFQRFKSRIDKLAKSGLKWTVVEPIADGPSKDSSCVRYDSVFEFAHRPSQGLSSLLAYLGM